MSLSPEAKADRDTNCNVMNLCNERANHCYKRRALSIRMDTRGHKGDTVVHADPFLRERDRVVGRTERLLAEGLAKPS